ncbi:response regulator transcription factor [Candidatus Dojkabacteria bacterium]|uniref:Response regulator transcription factor n=1 Tax=Candidatus Dojkabacteria bacterium TaxID=2099670 RepID=A0A955RK92_9BACT|nr:response regulator transcription factor [Candidatus Dojkabacteria bacterium]
MRILLIEDDTVTSSFIKYTLREQGYVVDHATDGKEGLQLARINQGNYSSIILDVMLPTIDGLKICKTLREENDTTPIMMLSSRDETENKIEGLNAGGDDYLTKPFEISELIARIKALQRRNNNQTEQILSIRHVSLDRSSHEVKVHDELIQLTRIEFRLLHLLMQNRGKVITRSEMLDKVWDMHGGEIFSNTINVHMKELRRKIQDDSKDPLIITVRGSGYKFAKQ